MRRLRDVFEALADPMPHADVARRIAALREGEAPDASERARLNELRAVLAIGAKPLPDAVFESVCRAADDHESEDGLAGRNPVVREFAEWMRSFDTRRMLMDNYRGRNPWGPDADGREAVSEDAPQRFDAREFLRSDLVAALLEQAREADDAQGRQHGAEFVTQLS